LRQAVAAPAAEPCKSGAKVADLQG
jgi:hypothetical protein